MSVFPVLITLRRDAVPSRRSVMSTVIDSPILIGMKLMLGYRILIEDKNGSAVQIERM